MRQIVLSAWIEVGVFASASIAHAAAPTQMSIQGKATDNAGAPLAPGSKSFLFRIFDSATLGVQLWPDNAGEPQAINTDVSGLWSANIGAVVPLISDVFSSDNRWLEIQIGTTTLPRVRLVTGPYAQRVATVDGASGGVITSKLAVGPGHTATGANTFVAGSACQATADYSTVGGGINNRVHAAYSSVAGGRDNWITPGSESEWYGTIGGGYSNFVGQHASTICGGHDNEIFAPYAVIGGGFDNAVAATANSSMIVGGGQCLAEGAFSLAAGRSAYTPHDGMFVWSDFSSAEPFPKVGDPNLFPGPNFFCCRTTGGVYFATGINASGHVTSASWLPAGGGAWVAFSDKNGKHGFQEVDQVKVLQKVIELPVTTWRYNTQSDSIRHIGPMAQDFRAAFGLGESEQFISPVDEAGVAFAAIQALAKQLKEKDAQILTLMARVEALEKK